MTTPIDSQLQYWKLENLCFVPTADTGELEPALVLPSLDDIREAVEEIEQVMKPDDPLREAVQPDQELILEFIPLWERACQPNNLATCLMWLDRSRKPRVEELGDRTTQTLPQGGWKWIKGKSPKSSVAKALVNLIAKRPKRETAAETPTSPTAVSTTNKERNNSTTMVAASETPAASSSSSLTSVPATQAGQKEKAPVSESLVKECTTASEPGLEPGLEPSVMNESLVKETAAKSTVPGTTGKVEMETQQKATPAETLESQDKYPTTNSVAEEQEEAPSRATPMEAAPMEVDMEYSTTGPSISAKLMDFMSVETAAKKDEPIEMEDTAMEGDHDKNKRGNSTEQSLALEITNKTTGDDTDMTIEATLPETTSQNVTPQKFKSKPTRVSVSPTVGRPKRNSPKPKKAKPAEAKPTGQDDDENSEQFVYVSDKVATSLLRKVKFTIRKNQFALPDGSASFESLDDLRADLRRFGVQDYDGWSDDDRRTLQLWIRWSILRSGDYKNGVPSDEQVPIHTFKDLLKMGAVQYDSTPLYMYPDVHARSANSLTPGAFTTENGLALSLAAEGLPDSLYEKFSPDELLSMEKYVDERAYEILHRDLFERRVQSSEQSSRRRGRDNQAAVSETSSTSPNKKRRTTPTKSKKSPTKSSKTSPSKARKSEQEEPSTPTTAVTHVTTEMVSVDAIPWPPAMEEVKEIEGKTDHERLSLGVAALKESGNVPVFSEGSSVEKNLKRVHDMIQSVIRSVGRHGGEHSDSRLASSKALYACGVPGTGKTMSLSWICQYVIKLHEEGRIGVEHDDDEEDAKWNFLRVNVNGKSANDVRNEIASSVQCRNVKHIPGRLKKVGLVLIVDEIDFMLGSQEGKKLLTNLLESANNQDLRFALIGISNAQMDEKYAEMQEIGTVRRLSMFVYRSRDCLVRERLLMRVLLFLSYSFATR